MEQFDLFGYVSTPAELEVDSLYNSEEDTDLSHIELADQPALFDFKPLWLREWVGMPEFIQEDLTPMQSVIVHFASRGDALEFSKLIGQTITDRTRSVWFPEAEIGRMVTKRYADES